MTKLIARFVKDESGATAIEYGLIAALISVGIIMAAQGVGESITGTFENVSGAMDAAGGGEGGE
ncbi:MAG: Flp family type IVb pilin [Phyllobacterium sp.]